MKNMEKMVPIIESLSSGKIVKDSGDIKIYEKSLKAHDNVHLLMVKDGTEKFLLAAGSGPLFDELDGEAVAENGKVCALRSEEHTSELQSRGQLVCRLLSEKKTQ